MSNIKKEYKVLQPIGWNGRREKGEIIRLSDEEAKAYSPDMIALNVAAPIKEEENSTPLSEQDVDTLKKSQLEELAAEMGLEVTGTKADLVERIKLAKEE